MTPRKNFHVPIIAKDGEVITVGELKEFIKNYPGHAEVWVDNGNDSNYVKEIWHGDEEDVVLMY